MCRTPRSLEGGLEFQGKRPASPYSCVNAAPNLARETTGPVVRPLLVDAKQAARLLGIGRTTLYELIHAEAITPVRIGRCVRFAVADLETFVAEGCVGRSDAQKTAGPAATLRQPRRRRVDPPELQLFDTQQPAVTSRR